MANNNLAHPYANALFEAAQASDTLDQWLSDLAYLAEIARNKDFSALIGNPRLTRDELHQMLLGFLYSRNQAQTTALGANSLGANFLLLLQDNNRLHILPEIFSLFEQLVEQKRNTAKALIQSAYALSAADQAKLARLLSDKLGKSISVNVEVNPQLIGGIKILINDIVIDASVKGSLNNLATQLIR